MKKIDFKKDPRHLYQSTAKEMALVEVPAMNFLMIDGQGDPNTSRSYQAAVEALFSVSYAIKFKVKKTLAIDYGVLPLEGLWWADDMAHSRLATSQLEVDDDDHAARVRHRGHGARHHRRGEEEERTCPRWPIALRALP